MNSIKGIKILVVEDNILNQKILKLILHKLGAEIFLASNGQEAIDMMNINGYDIVLMDLNMPVMDGYETARHIRAVLKSNIPIIALSADNLISEDKELVNVGINAGLTKPFENESFCKLVLKLLNNNNT